MSISKDLDELGRKTGEAEYKILQRYRKSVIIPFCDKHGLKMVNGMGTWCFWKNGEQVSIEKATHYNSKSHLNIPLPVDVREVMEAQMVTGRAEAGSYMEDYTSPTYSNKLIESED